MKKAPPVRLGLRKLFVGLITALLMGAVGYPNAPSVSIKAVASGPCDLGLVKKDFERLTSIDPAQFVPADLAVISTASEQLCSAMDNNTATGAGQLAAPGTYISTQPDLREVGRTRIVVATATYLSNNRTTSASGFRLEKVGGPEIV